jgi:hypothetical protein
VPLTLRPLLLVGILLAGGEAAAQVSPGPLARSHQSLDGPLNCTKCHGGGNVPMNSLCLDCHTEIRWLTQRGRGLHATNPSASCASCHPDHAGREFEMIRWPGGTQEGFDHRRTGWPLEQSHAEVKCLDCHTAEFRTGEAGRLSPRRGNAGWVGLERECVSCHEDVHRKSLSVRCETCHDLKGWKVASRFDHENSRYPLTGAHAEVTCEACHRPPREAAVRNQDGDPIPAFKPLPFNQCSDCHRDPHNSRLGPKCDDCHVTRGFTAIGRDRFNHERTRYQLRGKHLAVACADCHKPNSPREWNPPFATCSACHADAHGGQATLAGKPADCDACHTVAGFRPGSYTVSRHRTSKYPLEGKHMEVACASCHVRRPGPARNDSLGSSRVLMRPAYATCRSCHADDHRGQLAQRPGRGACEDCHRVQGWKPATYTAARHATLRVTLEGKHAAVTCEACHGPSRPGLPPLPTRDSLGHAGVALVLESRCASCHVDPHEGRFSPAGARPNNRDCVGCHDYAGFRPSLVDIAQHQTYRWKLEGAHRAVPCETCHEESRRPLLRSTLVRPARAIPPAAFAVRDTGCGDCHRTPHGNQFASRRDKGRCESCHTLDAFKPASRFDHKRDAAFALEGAHARARCEKCHVPGRSGTATMVRYRPVDTRCESCHLEVPNGRPTR